MFAAGDYQMYLLAVMAGFIAGVTAWLIASHWIAVSIARVEDRRPALVGSRQLRAAEAVACGVLFLACFALASWLTWLLWIQIK
jgi:hypothetical protein